MAIFKTTSLEGFIYWGLFLLATMITLPTFYVLAWLEWPVWAISLSVGLLILFLVIYISWFRRRILSSFDRATLHVEAIGAEDYNLVSKPAFKLGKVGDFHRELEQLSVNLLEKKSRYDQHAFLIYQLIDQLDTPVLVFDQKNRLSYANGAFTLLYNEPWQMHRLASPHLLGLEMKNGKWSLIKGSREWQITQSRFIDGGESHQLLVFLNIELALSAVQLRAWQQIIRVIGHEINNSLTPVSSLAESLLGRTESKRDEEALRLISERCHHLQDFINRYASLSRQLDLNCEQIAAKPLVDRVSRLFSNIDLAITVKAQRIWADEAFLEQVFINLITNACEAGADRIAIILDEFTQKTRIRVVDNGQGFANMENLFVPLFSTKQHGQGIGLSFCRNVIKQHQGSIQLHNNPDRGVTVTITLPAARGPETNPEGPLSD